MLDDEQPWLARMSGGVRCGPRSAQTDFRQWRRGHTENGRMNERQLVSIVDDNESVRESLPELLRHSGFDAQAFASAEDFLESEAVGRTNCLILDVGLPGMSGPD